MSCLMILLYRSLVLWGRLFPPKVADGEDEATGEERDTGLLAFVLAALATAIKGALPMG